MKNRQSMTPFTISLMSAGLLLAGAAQAATYTVRSSTSSLDDVRHIGGASIEAINSYTPHGGDLDPTDPQAWPLMISNIGGWDPEEPAVAPPRDGNSTRVAGTVDIEGGEVGAATLNQLDTLVYGTFQSYDFGNGYGTLTNLVVEGLVWTYDAETGQLIHQTQADNDDVALAVCTPAGPNFGGAGGTAVSGQCNSLLRGAVNNSSGTSLWNWDGIAGDEYLLTDTAPGGGTPWHPSTNLTLDIGGHAAVIWDLSGFVEGEGGEVRAYVTNSLFNSGTNNATGVSAVYTLDLVLAVANDDAFDVQRNSLNNELDVLANDTDFTDPLAVVIVTEPDQGGTATVNGDNTITYTPALDFTGTETFTYEVTGGEGEMDTATVTVTVKEKRSGGSSGLDLWSLALLGGLPLFRRHRRN